MDAESLQRRVAAALPGALVEATDTTGGGDHFDVLVVAEAFAGLPLVKRHRLVYDALGDLMRSQIHALSLRTVTPAEQEQGLVTQIGRSES